MCWGAGLRSVSECVGVCRGAGLGSVWGAGLGSVLGAGLYLSFAVWPLFSLCVDVDCSV